MMNRAKESEDYSQVGTCSPQLQTHIILPSVTHTLLLTLGPKPEMLSQGNIFLLTS